MRRVLIFLVAVLLLTGSAAVLAAGLTERALMLRGVADPITADVLPYKLPRLGVNAELTLYDDRALTVQLDLMRRAGVTWVRQFIYWDAVEAARDTYDWSEYDRIVGAVADTPDLRLVAVLMNTPAWGRDHQALNDPTAPPREPDDFAAFAAAFAARYAEQVDFYQIWDEPNLYTNWGRLPPRAARYAVMLEGAYNAIHGADPTANVIAAALAPTIETGPDNISDLIYLRDLYAFGARDFMDAAAGKPYGFDFGPDDRRVQDRLLNFSRFTALREIMVEHGDAHKPLWGSNWGWNSLPEGWTGVPSIWGQVSLGEQIAYTLRALERAEREWPWLGGFVLHHWNPPYPADFPQQGFALTTPNGMPTPLLVALTERPRTEHASDGWFPPRTADTRYSGVWTFSESGADIGWLRDSRLSFTFIGTDVALLLRQDDYVAHLYVTVDGQPANALPRDAEGNAYIVLSSGSRMPEAGPVAVARDLPYGTHTLELIADQGFDRYALMGFAVGSGDLARPYEGWIAGAVLAFALSLGAVIATGAALPWAVWQRRFSALFHTLGLPVQAAISLVTSLALMSAFLLSFGQPESSFIRREPFVPVAAFLSAGAVYINPALPLTLLAGAILFWCIAQRISLGLMLILLYAPFFLFPVELYSFAFPMVELLTLITAGAWLLNLFAAWGRLWQSGAEAMPFLWPELRWPDRLAIAYLILGIAAVAWSEYKGFALTELRTLFIEPGLFYAIWRTTRLTERELRWLSIAFVAAGTLAATVSLAQYVTGQAIITAEDESRRLAGIYGSPNNLALMLGRCLPFALAALLAAKSSRTRVIAAVAGAVMLVAVVLTQSVGGLFIGLPAALIAVALFAHGRRALPWIAAAAVIAVIGFGIAASQSERFSRALDFTQGTNFYRIRVMQSAVNAIADRPLTGLGLDQFLYAFRDTYIYPDAWPEPDLSHPHNFLLDFWVRLGILGAGLAVAYTVAGWRLLRTVVSAARGRPFWGWVALGVAGALVDVAAHGLLDNSVFVIDLAYQFFALFALGLAVRHLNTLISPP